MRRFWSQKGKSFHSLNTSVAAILRFGKRHSLRLSLASKVYLVVTVILLATLTFFVALDYLQEQEELLRAKLGQLSMAATLTRSLLEIAPSALAFERLRQHALLPPGEAFSVYVVRDGAVVVSSDENVTEFNPLKRIDWVTEGEAWETTSGLAVSIPYGHSSPHSSMEIVVEGDAGPVRAALRRTLKMHVIHGLVTVAAMAFGVAWVLRRAVLTPLYRILSAINIVERGTWKVDVPNGRGDEIGVLTGAFNKMGRNLDLTVRQLVQAEKLSLLALLAIRVERELGDPLLQIEEGALALSTNGYPIPEERRREVARIEQASRQARRAIESLDESFFDALSKASLSSRDTSSPVPQNDGPVTLNEGHGV